MTTSPRACAKKLQQQAVVTAAAINYATFGDGTRKWLFDVGGRRSRQRSSWRNGIETVFIRKTTVAPCGVVAGGVCAGVHLLLDRAEASTAT